MITVLDMETGEILERFETPTAMDRTDPAAVTITADPIAPFEMPGCATRTQPTTERPAIRMPVDLASLDIAEVLARFL